MGRPKTLGKCKAEGCERPAHARDLCNIHYLREYNRMYVRGSKGCDTKRRIGIKIRALDEAKYGLQQARRAYMNACGVEARLVWKARVAEAKEAYQYEIEKARRRTPKAKRFMRICIQCGTEYRAPQKPQLIVVCSQECRDVYIRQRNEEKGRQHDNVSILGCGATGDERQYEIVSTQQDG